MDILRRFRWKHEIFNQHKKYKYLRPLYPLSMSGSASDDLQKSEIQIPDEKSGSKAQNLQD